MPLAAVGKRLGCFVLTEIYAVVARGDIASPDLITKYWKEFINTPPSPNQLMKELFDSYVGVLAEKNEAQAKEIMSKDLEIMSKEQEKAKLKTTNSVLSMYAFNKSPEGISAKLGLELAEVNRILETAAGAV
ncbi:MAG: hypothetical protein LBR80_01510 [Deltaproteobacteria bacterium]|jgi:hypothetical protein|nr:hypothetical protein [Deltaproteobacteria bacterium]